MTKNITIKVKNYYVLSITLLFLILQIVLLFKNIFIINYLAVFYLLFIPGFMIFTLLRVNLNDFTITVLMSLGLSLFFITLISLTTNTLLSILGMEHPLQKNNLLAFTFCYLLILLILYVKNVKYTLIKLEYDIKSILLLLIILVLTIAGTINLEKDNRLIILSFILLMILPALCYFRVISEKSWTFAVWIFALSCVLYNSLFGKYIRATDNISEIFIIKDFVLKNQIWIPRSPNNILAMPNVVLLIPFINIFTNNIFITYKLIVPFISSFIPLVIYKAFELRYGRVVALYSAFFFSSLFIYFTWASITMKMVTAGLYLSLILLLLILKLEKSTAINVKITLIIFTVSLIFSHYGTSATFAIVLIIYAILYLILSIYLKIRKEYEFKKLKFCNYILFYVALYFGYSIYITSGSIHESVVKTVYNTIADVRDILNPEKNYGSEILLSNVPTYLQILKILYILAFIFIIIGLGYEFAKRWKERKIDIIIFISLIFSILTAVPYIFPTGQYGGGRIWYISTIFTAPFLIIGFNSILNVMFRNINQNFKRYINPILCCCLFIMVFFAFNSGLASELIWKYNVGPSIYLSYPRIIKCGDLWEKEYLDRVTLSSSDILAAKWLSIKMNPKTRIYCDKNGLLNLLVFGLSRGDVARKVGNLPNVYIIPKDKPLREKYYIYLTEFNIKYKLIKVSGRLKPEFIDFNKIINICKIDKIYTNGKAVVGFIV